MQTDTNVTPEIAALEERLRRLEDRELIWRLFLEYRRHAIELHGT